jgi:molybdenum cofactor sulfurtransferase
MVLCNTADHPQLYAKSLVEDFSKDLLSNLYGNPHSASTPSAVAGHRIDAIREKALRFFKADPKEWDLVFVANATAAIKLTAECIRDHAATTQQQLWYGYHRDSHTSLVGIRELTPTSRCFSSDEEVEKWMQCGGAGGPLPRQLGLFAYPGQSNMTGRRLPLSWPGMIRRQIPRAKTYTLLDAAALASTAQLDLSNTDESPDFVALSFYKIFGFPNIGALLVRKESAHVLANRKYFGGGTVDMVVSINDTWHATKTATVHDALEDGTLPFHSIFALDHAINVHKRLYGSEPMKFISRHTAQLSKQMHDSLCNLRHRNGNPVIRLYKEACTIYGDSNTQGATCAFNVLNSSGALIGYAQVERAADAQNIYVRSGSLCNPGGMATYLEWTPTDMKAAFAAGHRCSKPTELVDGRATGVVRASLGAMSTASDVRALISFLRATYVDTTAPPAHTLACKQPVSAQRASFVRIQLPEQQTKPGIGIQAATHKPLPPTPTLPPSLLLRNRLRRSADVSSTAYSASNSSTSVSALPRSQSSHLIGLVTALATSTPSSSSTTATSTTAKSISAKPSRRFSALDRVNDNNDSHHRHHQHGHWGSFWREETAAFVAAGAVEREACGGVSVSAMDAESKILQDKEKDKGRHGFRMVARALMKKRTAA